MGQWQSQPVCTSPACLHASSYILENLAPNWEQMDPCTEFDQMVCYGFSEHGDDNESTIRNLQKRNSRIMRRILESPSHGEAAGYRSTLLRRNNNNYTVDEHNFDMLRKSYQACMDVDAVEAAGIKPLTDLIVSINKTWPASPNDLLTKVDASEYAGLSKAILSLENVAISPFRTISQVVIPDPLNSKVNRFLVEVPYPTLRNMSQYFDPDEVEIYSQSIADVFLLVYPNINNTTATALAGAVVSLEADLAKIVAPYQEVYQMMENPWDTIKNTSVAKIAAAAPALSLDKLVAGLSPAGHVSTEILLEEPSLWPNISQMITRQPKAAVQGYMIWKAINSVALMIESPDLWEALGSENPAGSTDRWELCVEMTTALVGHMSDHYYVSATYPEPVLQAADKLTTNIRTQFKKRISDLDWMSDTAKQRATSKVDNMRQNIGYQTSNPDVRSTQSLATYYDTLNFTSDYFSNVLAAQGHMATKAYAELARPADRTLFVGGSISRANAYYNPSTNSMFIPSGISQLPIFHHDLPDYALYGGLGVVIGHEMTHGFDDGGSMYDERAELRTWWDNSTVANFANRTQCFVDQYSEFEVDMPGGGKANVDGALTLGENLSDAGGMRTAYDAWVAERNAMPGTWDQDLPGLGKFTHEQLFFVFFGNMWCGKTTPAMAAMLLQMDNHAPDLQRILGGTANSRAFREAFKCKVKEPTCELF